MTDTTTTLHADQTRAIVRDHYGQIAKTGGSCAPGCCGTVPAGYAQTLGYSTDEQGAAPAGADLGLGCGNPTAIASLRAGETVLDLGAGGGFDCFLAARQVGPTGKVIGVDMTPDMVALARSNARKVEATNVEFRLGEIEHLPVADASIDVVISNCVINLSPQKPQVWREIARALRPGGRVAVSDIALLKPLPEAARSMVEALVGCVAGAALVDESIGWMRSAGLTDVGVRLKTDYLDAMESSTDPLYQRLLEVLPPGSKASDYVVSAEFTAMRPKVRIGCCN